MTAIHVQGFRRSALLVSAAMSLSLSLILAFAVPVRGSTTRIKIGTVSPECRPTAGPGFPEPVSMASFSFEINKETSRARVVVEYTYPDQQIFALEGGLGPQPTVAQLPGLTYDSAAKTVVYEFNGKRTICAIVGKRKMLFWSKSVIEPTGSCVVSARTTDHAEDDGWSIHRFRAIDTDFEVR